MSTGYIIRDTETGERFTAGSGKNIWSTQGGAKVAWRQSVWTLHRLIGEPGSSISGFDPGSFNDQTRFVVEELTSKSALKSVFIVVGDYEVGIEQTAFTSEQAARDAYKEACQEYTHPEDELPYYEVKQYWLEL